MGQQRQRAPAILLRSNRANPQKNKKSNLRSFFSSALRFRHRLDLNAADFDALMVGKDQAPKSGLDRPVRSTGHDAAPCSLRSGPHLGRFLFFRAARRASGPHQ